MLKKFAMDSDERTSSFIPIHLFVALVDDDWIIALISFAAVCSFDSFFLHRLPMITVHPREANCFAIAKPENNMWMGSADYVSSGRVEYRSQCRLQL